MNMITDVWNQITSEIKAQVNLASLNLFLNSVTPARIVENTLVLEALNEVCKEWVERRYRSVIQKILQGVDPSLSCVFVTKERGESLRKPVQLELDSKSEGSQFSHEEKSFFSGKSTQQKVEGMFNSKYTFDLFIVGKSNQFAHAVCQAVSKSPGKMYNPVFVYGGAGLGKTHLMQAIGHEILRNFPKLKVAYLSSETFTNEFIDLIKDKRANEFRAKYRKIDLLLIDDVQFLAGKEAVIEEFFHTFNELFQNKKQIVLTSDSPPKKINKLEDRLVSRFEMGIVADVQSPDLETRVAILKNAASFAHVKFPDDVLMYLAQGVTNNVRELEGAFNRVVFFAGVTKRQVDKDLVDQVLKDFFQENAVGKISIPWIQKRVAEYYNIPENEITSKRRSRNFVLPRHVAIRLAQILTQNSLSQIGESFGGRDHTTVIHASMQIQKKLKEDRGFSAEFERIIRYVTPQGR